MPLAADPLTAAAYRLPGPGALRILGQDRREFIQRQTTNDIRTLAAGRALLTVLTSPTARILDVWRLVELPGEPDAITVLTLPGRAARTAAYLRTRIFFMDKVTVEDISAEIAQIELIGPRAGDVLAALGLPALIEPDAVIAGTGDYAALRAIGANPHLTPGTRLIGPAAGWAALDALLAQHNVPMLDEAAYEVLRLEAGLPAADHELSEEYTPLETGLDSAVSPSKGCYTGQEIIARQVNFDKVTRHMVGLRLDQPAAPGASVSVEGRTAGTVTSAALSPRFGPMALAVLKRPHHTPGTRVQVASDTGPVAGEVVALPFEQQRPPDQKGQE